MAPRNRAGREERESKRASPPRISGGHFFHSQFSERGTALRRARSDSGRSCLEHFFFFSIHARSK